METRIDNLKFSRIVTNEDMYIQAFNKYVLPILHSLSIEDDETILSYARDMDFERLYNEEIDRRVEKGTHRVLAELEVARIIEALQDKRYFRILSDVESKSVDVNATSAPLAARLVMRCDTLAPGALYMRNGILSYNDKKIADQCKMIIRISSKKVLHNEIDNFVRLVNQIAEDIPLPDFSNMFVTNENGRLSVRWPEEYFKE